MAKRQGHKHISGEQFRSLFTRGKPVRISQIAGKLGVDRSTVTRQMRKHGTLTSINQDAAFCVLPQMCHFEESDVCRFGETLFFRHGNQRDAICHVVTASQCGMTLPEINVAMGGGKMAVQALSLVQGGRLQRRKHDGRFVYFAADEQSCRRQLERREAATKPPVALSPEQSLAQYLAEESGESIELLVKVLLSCLRHPGFSAKSVALSLIRRGEQTSTQQVRKLFERFALRGKNS